MLLEPKQGITYGPVNSRRLGSSLGINLFPGTHKACSFDCIYCQYGLEQTISPWSTLNGLPSVAEVADAVRSEIGILPEPPAYVTFSGNGEATLHPLFNEIVDIIIEVRNATIPSAKTAILSNSSTAERSVIREALDHLDVRIMKLDAGNASMFARYNRNHSDINFERVIHGLSKLKDVTIQTLMTGGYLGNNLPDHVDSWISCLDIIQPTTIQLYSLDRASPSRNITKLRNDELEMIAQRVRSRGHDVTVYSRE